MAATTDVAGAVELETPQKAFEESKVLERSLTEAARSLHCSVDCYFTRLSIHSLHKTFSQVSFRLVLHEGHLFLEL